METVNHKYYVSLEVAKLLKQAGFDWEADTYYQHGILRDGWCSNKNKECMITCSAPTIEVAQKWLREVKDCIVLVDWYEKWEFVDAHYGYEVNNEHIDLSNNPDINEFPTYEEALEAGIKKALEIILEKGE